MSCDQISSLITSGSRGWAKYYSDKGAVFIRAQDINTDRLLLNAVARVKPPAGAEGTRTRVKENDILITITGANVTKAAVVNCPIKEGYVSQHVALVRPALTELAHWLHLWTIGPSHGRAQLLEAAYGAGKPGLNLDNVREMVIALPPLEEQIEIIRRVEALNTLADGIESRLAHGTEFGDKVRQAILAKAFRGELVPLEAELARREGRDYESAAALLARIAALRATADSERSRRKRSGRVKRKELQPTSDRNLVKRVRWPTWVTFLRLTRPPRHTAFQAHVEIQLQIYWRCPQFLASSRQEEDEKTTDRLIN